MKQIQEIANNPASVSHLTGASNYTWVHFVNEPQRLLSKPLTYFEGQFPSFIRIHKTALINPSYIQHIQPPKRAKAPGTIILQGGESLPISRRRWLELADVLTKSNQNEVPESGLVVVAPELEKVETIDETVKTGHKSISATRWLFAFSQDEKRRKQISQTIDEKWPHYAVRFFDNGTTLVEHLSRAATSDLPTLVLLDVRKVGWTVMNTLETIKTSKRFCRIPTLVFSREFSGSDVEVCYAAGANSVVRQRSDEQFDEILDRLYRYWLNFAALPAI